MNVTQRSGVIVAVVLVNLSCSHRLTPVDIPSDPVPGTYEILICKRACSFTDITNVVVRGEVVLFPTELTAAELDQFRLRGFEFTYYTYESPNGCFVLDTIEHQRTYAGIDPRGVMSWSIRDGVLQF